MAFWRTPRVTWSVTYGVTSADLNRIEDNIDYIKNTVRTPNDSTGYKYSTGDLTKILNTITGQLKYIIGSSSWTSNISRTLTDLYYHMVNYNNPHNVRADQIADTSSKVITTDYERSKIASFETGATADQSASELLYLVRQVDGAGSGINLDKLRGRDREHVMGVTLVADSWVLTHGNTVPSIGRNYQWNIPRPIFMLSEFYHDGVSGRSGSGLDYGMDVDQNTREVIAQIRMGDGLDFANTYDNFWVVVDVLGFG